ncbi:hypothetical protein [Microbacterium halotolerans]|nr:hypothetical protein [Microbacterium halotolerans]
MPPAYPVPRDRDGAAAHGIRLEHPADRRDGRMSEGAITWDAWA